MDDDGQTCAYLNLIFIKKQQLQIVLKATQTLDVLIFSKTKFCLMSGLKFTVSDVASFLSDNLSGLEKNYIQAWNNVIRSKFSHRKVLQNIG